MGAEVYSQSVFETTPIGRSLRKLQENDKASLEVKFNIAHYLVKRERPFTDHPHLILWSNGLEVKLLDSHSRGLVFKTTTWLQG